jgi:hypothetical protein
MGHIFVNRFLYGIMVMVSFGIYCGEERAIVSIIGMLSSAEELTPIKSLKKIEEFTGNFVAYKMEKSPYENFAIAAPDKCYYGYLARSQFSGESSEYILSGLLKTNWQSFEAGLGARVLSESFIKQDNILMRKVTPKEILAIVRGLSAGGIRLGYHDPTEEKGIEKPVHNIELSTFMGIADAVYYNRYSKGLFEWPEFRELLYCINQQYPDLPNDLLLSNKCILRHLGPLKLQSCMGGCNNYCYEGMLL